MRHIITRNDYDEWAARDEPEILASSGGRDTFKRLSVTRRTRRLVVQDRKKEVYSGYDVDAAIAAYNDAP